MFVGNYKSLICCQTVAAEMTEHGHNYFRKSRSEELEWLGHMDIMKENGFNGG